MAIPIAAAFAAAMGACDVRGTQDDQDAQGPALQVESTNVDNASLPADGIIELRFNRLLLPQSVTRQSVSLRTAGGVIESNPIVQYDPVLRTVRIVNPNPNGGVWLVENQPYKIVLGRPLEDGADAFALRAIDGAYLKANSRGEIAFTTSPPTFIRRRPVLEFCRDVYSVFAKYCTSNCHAAEVRPFASLLLDTEDGLLRTAIGHVSQFANTGAKTGTPGAPSRVFGIDMPIIDPGSPGNSYLIYKMLLLSEARPLNYQCAEFGPPNVLFDGGSFLPPDERTILSNLMTGQKMPPVPPYPTPEEIERVSEWIAQGTVLDVNRCKACLMPGDASVMDAGDAGDAGTDATMDADMDADMDATVDAADAGTD